MAGGDPPPTAPPVAEAPPAVEAPAPATESLGAAPPQPDLEAAEAPPLPAQAPPATQGWRARFAKKTAAGDEDPAAAAAPTDHGSALPPSYPAEGGAELPGERVQVPPRKWPTLSRYLWMGWDSRPWPPVTGAYATEIPSRGAVAAAAAPVASAAAAAGAAGGAASTGGGGTSWFAWPDFGGVGGGQREPEAWCKDYVKLGRWASLVFTTWQELCFTSGVHPFTGESMEAGQAGTPVKAKGAAGEAPASAKARGGAAAPPAGAAEVQRCFMQACSSAQDQLARETSGLMLVAVLLAVAAAALIGSLANRQAWNGGDYAVYVLLILSAACSLTHLAIGTSVFLAAAGRPAKSFFRLLLSFEPLARAGVASFFAAITTLLAGLLAMAFNAAWKQRDGDDSGYPYRSADSDRAAVTMVSVLFLALAAIYYIPSYIAGRWMLRCQDKQEGRSRVVSKATLLTSLEPLLAWSFADHTIPPAFRTQAEQAGEWEPLRRYCETHSYEVYREFELLPWWQAWPLRVANLLLSTLGPPSLLRLRPTGSPYQFDGLEAPALCTADAGEEKKAAAAAAAAEEEAAVVGGADVAPPTFSVHVEE